MNQSKQWFTIEKFWYGLDLSISLIHFDKGLFDPDGVIDFRESLSLQRFDPDGVINKPTACIVRESIINLDYKVTNATFRLR
jgi:hypothetical protein